MASGARPSSNQRSQANAAPPKKTRTPRGHDHCNEFCVVCGDRACNHHYYGVAACHGCKCFFWRSVKQQQQYICRYEKNCDISPNHRNACRYCRFQRCLAVGMQPEAVRMQTTRNNGGDHTAAAATPGLLEKRALSHNVVSSTVYETLNGKQNATDLVDCKPFTESMEMQATRKENDLMLQAVLDLERRSNEVADFSENDSPYETCTLDELFHRPRILECYRTRVLYCVRLRRATAEELEFCKFRTLTRAFDMVNGLDELAAASKTSTTSTTVLPVADKVRILRAVYGPLTVFDLAAGTYACTKDQSLLCLPTGITLSCNEQTLSNTFINQSLVSNITATLVRSLEKAAVSDEEAALLKGLILATDSADGLSTTTVGIIEAVRGRIHSALHQVCSNTRTPEAATLRFAELLHLMSKLVILSHELIEHFRLQFTFAFSAGEPCRAPLFYELFGDLFQQTRESSQRMDANRHRFPKPTKSDLSPANVLTMATTPTGIGAITG